MLSIDINFYNTIVDEYKRLLNSTLPTLFQPYVPITYFNITTSESIFDTKLYSDYDFPGGKLSGTKFNVFHNVPAIYSENITRQETNEQTHGYSNYNNIKFAITVFKFSNLFKPQPNDVIVFETPVSEFSSKAFAVENVEISDITSDAINNNNNKVMYKLYLTPYQKQDEFVTYTAEFLNNNIPSNTSSLQPKILNFINNKIHKMYIFYKDKAFEINKYTSLLKACDYLKTIYQHILNTMFDEKRNAVISKINDYNFIAPCINTVSNYVTDIYPYVKTSIIKTIIDIPKTPNPKHTFELLSRIYDNTVITDLQLNKYTTTVFNRNSFKTTFNINYIDDLVNIIKSDPKTYNNINIKSWNLLSKIILLKPSEEVLSNYTIQQELFDQSFDLTLQHIFGIDYDKTKLKTIIDAYNDYTTIDVINQSDIYTLNILEIIILLKRTIDLIKSIIATAI